MSDRDGSTSAPGWPQRLAAWLSLVTAVCAVGFLATQAVRRWDVLLVTVASLSVLVGSAWIALSRRGPKRTAALASGAVALAVFVVVVIASESLRVLLVALGLAILMVAAGRVALDERDDEEPSAQLRSAPKPSHPVLIMNLKSGGGKAERFALVDRCHERGIEPVVLTPGADLLQLAEDAVARGADVIGMAGGDGSQALVASVASRLGVPFVVVPAGTRNHFALDLGLDREDVIGALDAFAEGVERTIDLAEVNGRVFVNNASMGVYAKIVQSDEYRDAKVQTTAAKLPELLGPGATPLDLRFALPGGDEATTAQLLLVSNNSVPAQRPARRGHEDAPGRGSAGCRLAARGRGARREQAGRARGRRPAVALRRLQPVGGRRLRGALERARGDRGRRRGPAPRTTLALRDPAGGPDRSPLGSAAGRSRGPVPVRISSRDTFAALWSTARGKPVRRS